jgi:hypothetical protein
MTAQGLAERMGGHGWPAELSHYPQNVEGDSKEYKQFRITEHGIYESKKNKIKQMSPTAN